MARIRLIPATTDHLSAYLNDPVELASMLESSVPEGWPEFPEAIPFTQDRLTSHPHESSWWMHFFIDAETSQLVGSGGFSGPPDERVVEIGYEIAPVYRRQGFATAATEALVGKAAESGEVALVVAHTLATDERSAGVLRRTGFAESSRLNDPDAGEVIRWERKL